MPEKSKNDKTKVGLVVGIVLATLAVLAFLCWGYWQNSRYDVEASENSRAIQARQTDFTQQHCSKMSEMEKVPCVAAAVQVQVEGQRGEQELAAQRQSALWSFVMGVAAVIGMGVSFVGVGLVWTTFEATRRGNQLTIDALQQGRVRERAYVIVEEVEFHQSCTPDEFRRGVLVRLVNAGQSPALETRRQLRLTIVDRGFDERELPPVKGSGGSLGYLAPEKTTDLIQSSRVEEAIWKAIAEGDLACFASGWFKYRDVFGEEHETHFRWKIDAELIAQGFMARRCEGGNWQS
ncbi:MAG TPA: hypothetical protein VEZ59_04270 [Sphingopyxis sp.]|nr:hypothetical protein [Sphingopyxis sp.]